jgi:hypothetical protein
MLNPIEVQVALNTWRREVSLHAMSTGVTRWLRSYNVWRTREALIEAVSAECTSSWYASMMRQAYIDRKPIATVDEFVDYIADTISP